MASTHAYILAKGNEASLSDEAWKWKLHALKQSRKAISQVIPMPTTKLLNLTPLYSSSDKWEKIYKVMEVSKELVNSIWLLVQDRVQQHRLHFTTLREDFLEKLVSHCNAHACDMAEKESQINIEASRVEYRDLQIQKQNRAFKEIIEHLNTIRLEDQQGGNPLQKDLLSACLQSVQEHVRVSKELKDDREKLLHQLAESQNQRNELHLQVKSLEGMIFEMEQNEHEISKKLSQTREDHKRDIEGMLSRFETVIDNHESDRKAFRKELDEAREQHQHDNKAHKKELHEAREQHKKELSALGSTLIGRQGMGISRMNNRFEELISIQDHGFVNRNSLPALSGVRSYLDPRQNRDT